MELERRCTLLLPDGRRFGPTTLATVAAWAREGRVPGAATVEFVGSSTADARAAEHRAVSHDGPPDGVTAETVSVSDVPELRAILSAPPTERDAAIGRGSGPTFEPSPIATIIPYRNPPALIGYYLSLLSLIPLVGLPLGVIAIVLGVIGLQRRRAQPAVKGTAHAAIAVVVGALGVVISGVVLAAILLRF